MKHTNVTHVEKGFCGYPIYNSICIWYMDDKPQATSAAYVCCVCVSEHINIASLAAYVYCEKEWDR